VYDWHPDPGLLDRRKVFDTALDVMAERAEAAAEQGRRRGR
jgi:hypothetical protein